LFLLTSWYLGICVTAFGCGEQPASEWAANRGDEWKVEVLIDRRRFSPLDLVAPADGKLYLTDAVCGCVWAWSRNTALQELARVPRPGDITADEAGNIFVGQQDQPVLWVIARDKRARKIDLSDTVGKITSLTFDSSRGSVAILDSERAQVVLVSHSGDVVPIVSDPFKLLDRAQEPKPLKSIWRARAFASGVRGEFFVLDYTGSIQTIFPGAPRKERDWRGPTTFLATGNGNVAFHPRIGLIATADRLSFFNTKVLRMRVPEGRFEGILFGDDASGFEGCTGVAVSADRTVYLSDANTGLVVALRRQKG
jgi:hypothetical protein